MEMKNPHVIWAAVAIVVALVGGAVALVAMDKDVSVILTLAGLVAMPVLGAFGAALYQKLDQVKDASNGHLSASNATLNRMMEMQQKTQEQLTTLALSMNPQSPIVSPEKESDPGS